MALSQSSPTAIQFTTQVVGGSANKWATKWEARAERPVADILIIRNAVPMLSELVELSEAYPHLFGGSALVSDEKDGYLDENYRSSKSLTLIHHGIPEAFNVFDVLMKSVEARFVLAYRDLVNEHIAVTRGRNYELLRYQTGEFFKLHQDVVASHPALSSRQLSLVGYCNGDFDGGGLFFPRQETTIQPEPGMVVLFPSGMTHPHASLPIKSGTKYSVVSWFH